MTFNPITLKYLARIQDLIEDEIAAQVDAIAEAQAVK